MYVYTIFLKIWRKSILKLADFAGGSTGCLGEEPLHPPAQPPAYEYASAPLRSIQGHCYCISSVFSNSIFFYCPVRHFSGCPLFLKRCFAYFVNESLKSRLNFVDVCCKGRDHLFASNTTLVTFALCLSFPNQRHR